MKQASLPLVVLSGLACFAPAAVAQNFLFNGGFESVVSPADWQITGLAVDYRTQAAALFPTEGSLFAGFNLPGVPANPTGEPGTATHLTQYVALGAGTYQFRFDLASASLGNATLNYELTPVDGGTLSPTGSPVLTGSAEALTTGSPLNPELYWTLDAGGYFSLATAETLRVRLFANGSYLDAVTLTAVPEPGTMGLVAGLALGAVGLLRRVRR